MYQYRSKRSGGRIGGRRREARTGEKLQRPCSDGDVVVRQAIQHQCAVLGHGLGVRSHEVHEAHEPLHDIAVTHHVNMGTSSLMVWCGVV